MAKPNAVCCKEWREKQKRKKKNRVSVRLFRQRSKEAKAVADEKARKLEEKQRQDGVVQIRPIKYHPLQHRQREDTGDEDVLILGVSLTDLKKVAVEECKYAIGDAIEFGKKATLYQIADLVNTTSMEVVHARDTARVVWLERQENVNVYTCNDMYMSQHRLRDDRHISGDWNQSSDRGVACRLQGMAVRFGKVYMDYIYLPGTAYTASRYAKDGFFTVTLPALKDRLMLRRTSNGKPPAIFLPATKHILARLCCIVDIKADSEFSYT